MSRFLYHQACPKCGSRDNVAVYDDGHGWCFGCREVVIEPEHRLLQRKKRRSRESDGSGNPEDSSRNLRLPIDYTTDLPVEGLQWLNKYNLTPREIQQHRIGWSEAGWKIRQGSINYAPLLILPVFDVYENLLMYQARYFGSQTNECPKYWTVGARGVVHTIGTSPVVTLVEDILSAIKVGRYTTGVPIFGSDISTDLVLALYNRYPDLIIWLDRDKRGYSHARANSIRWMFNSVRVIDSEADPKEYNNEELKRYLTM